MALQLCKHSTYTPPNVHRLFQGAMTVRYLISNDRVTCWIQAAIRQSACLQVEASLSCTAEGLHWLWVLHSAIEKIMLSQARANITALISFFQKEVNTGALTEQPPPRQVTSPPVNDSPLLTLHASRR